MKKRTDFYSEVVVNNIKERDMLSDSLLNMDIRTIGNYRITSVTEKRPDLISLKFYGSYHYGWLLALHNGFLDSINDFVSGIEIKIPDLSDYYRDYSRRAK